MNLWQFPALERMTAVLRGALDPLGIEPKGSLLRPDTVDIFSDVDLLVSLEILDMDTVIPALSAVGPVFGYEVHPGDGCDVLRICFENGWRFDITFNYRIKKPFTDENKLIHEFWFIAVTALMKLGRGDYLLAAHLALELWQSVIVMQMLERDERKGTNIHRFGDREAVWLPSFVPPGDDIEDEIVRLVFQAAERMDGGKCGKLREIYTKLS